MSNLTDAERKAEADLVLLALNDLAESASIVPDCLPVPERNELKTKIKGAVAASLNEVLKPYLSHELITLPPRKSRGASQ